MGAALACRVSGYGRHAFSLTRAKPDKLKPEDVASAVLPRAGGTGQFAAVRENPSDCQWAKLSEMYRRRACNGALVRGVEQIDAPCMFQGTMRPWRPQGC